MAFSVAFFAPLRLCVQNTQVARSCVRFGSFCTLAEICRHLR